MKLIAPLILAILSLTGCVAPSGTQAVLANDRTAKEVIATSYAADLTLMRRLVVTVLDTKRIITIGDMERAFIIDGLVSGTDANFEALTKLIGQPTTTNPLANEVKLGRLTREQAVVFLGDYAALGALSNGRDARRAKLATLAPGRAHDEATAALVKALDDHIEFVGKLIAELSANSDSFDAVLKAQQSIGVSSTDFAASIKVAASAFIKDPSKASSVNQLIDSAFGSFASK